MNTHWCLKSLFITYHKHFNSKYFNFANILIILHIINIIAKKKIDLQQKIINTHNTFTYNYNIELIKVDKDKTITSYQNDEHLNNG
ncbi:LOW QUALITY PROTEIN: hypothetical protein V1478_010338 [Vespula squamosa]|uniref:Uncharacterized protein n=1 Tax=Vespula squamosa TaxID=30214 RepID=A0ABD2AHH9_VESSQ